MRKIALFLIISLSLAIQVSGQKSTINSRYLVTNHIYSRVFQIAYNGQAASSFLLVNNNKVLLLTAKHLFPGVKNGTKISFYFNRSQKWEVEYATLYIHKKDTIDIAVLFLGEDNKGGFNTFEIGEANYAISQDCYFVGFPYAMKMEVDSTVNKGFPIAFVKKAIISAFIPDSLGNRFFLDGHNNKGFSGGLL